MKEINLLLDFIKKNEIPKSNHIRQYQKANEFYDILYENQETSIDETFDQLYPEKHSLSTRYKLINKLKELLFDNIQKNNYNNSKLPNYYLATIKAHKDWSTIISLTINNESKLSLILAKKTLKTALKYEMVELIVMITKHIVTKSQLIDGQAKEHIAYYDTLKEYIVFQEQSHNIDLMYGEIAYLYKSSKGSNTGQLIYKLRRYCKHIKEIQKTNHMFTFNMRAYTMLSTLYILEKDYENAIDNANKALTFIDQKSFTSEKNKRSFHNDLIISSIMINKNKEAEVLILENKNNVSLGSHNYFNILSYQFTNNVLGKNYYKLPELCIEAISSKAIKSNKFKYEIWQIRLSFLFFLNYIGVIKTDHPMITNFRIGKMLNELKIFTKDKKGMHNSLKVIEIILLLINNKTSKIIDKTDSLKVYSSTYLKGKHSYRNRLFFKMVQTMILRGNFHPARTKYLTEQNYDKLKNTNYDFIQIEQEIIPYDILWDFIILLLEKNKNK